MKFGRQENNMEELEEAGAEETRKLTKRAKGLKIDDHDVSQWEEISSAFSEQWRSSAAGTLPKNGQIIYSDLAT